MPTSDHGQDNPFISELLEDFFVESDEHLTSVRRSLLALERQVGQPQLDRGLLDELFRSFHTLKGLSGMVGLREAELLAHHMESALRTLRLGQLRLTAAAVDVLLDSASLLEQVLNSRRLAQPSPDIQPLIRRIEQLLPEADEPGPGPEPAVQQTAADAGVLKLSPQEQVRLLAAREQGARIWRFEFTPTPELVERGVNVNVLRARLESSGELLHIQPLLSAGGKVRFLFLLASAADAATFESWRQDGVSYALHHEPDAALPQGRNGAELPSRGELTLAPSNMVRVDMARLDDLLRTVGELMISRGHLGDQLARAELLVPAATWRELQEVNGDLERQLRDLRAAAMRMRLVPIGTVFERMQFVVRDLAQDYTRQIETQLIGNETEIDKYIVERMLDPLLHLVRNAISHGLESPEERVAAGKPATARLTLRAAAAGNMVLVEVEDDGRGLDLAAIAERARALGLSRPANLEDSSALLDLLCEPGFSMRAEADRASGRGIGMAVVKAIVHELGGQLSLQTRPGQGTCFQVRLPLTLVIVDALIVVLSGQTYALPLATVREVIEIQPADLRLLEHNELLAYRGGTLPLIRPSQLFGLPRSTHSKEHALVIGSGSSAAGLVVERVTGQREIVVRAINDPLVQVPGISGATELGDGNAVLILDASALLQLARQRGPRQITTPSRQVPEASRRMTMADTGSGASESFILFELAGTTYGLRSRTVQQMEMVEQITPVPNAAPFIEGVIFSRGQIIPAINLRVRFGFEKIPFDVRTRMVVLRSGERVSGLIVDTAREFVNLPAEAIQPPPEAIGGLSGNYLEGIAMLGERPILILNVEEVLVSAETVPPASSEL